jgi:CubicO group peptidase (beta-lactamase class C family)
MSSQKNNRLLCAEFRVIAQDLQFTFFQGYSVNDPITTLTQILNGEPPANTAPVLVNFMPDSKCGDSGGGLLIAQLLMIDVTGLSFPQIMRGAIFEKFGMKDRSFENPLPPIKAKQAARQRTCFQGA